MAKGSVRKKGKKWYYRFYVEDASGKMVQKEYAGTESKSETEKLLRKALEDYEDKKFVAKADNLTVGELLDMWAEEELKTGTLSNGTVENYLGAIRCIKKHPIADRKLKTVTAEHLQAFLDLLTFGGEFPDGKVKKGGMYEMTIQYVPHADRKLEIKVNNEKSILLTGIRSPAGTGHQL